jgi:hypothetical protein
MPKRRTAEGWRDEVARLQARIKRFLAEHTVPLLAAERRQMMALQGDLQHAQQQQRKYELRAKRAAERREAAARELAEKGGQG